MIPGVKYKLIRVPFGCKNTFLTSMGVMTKIREPLVRDNRSLVIDDILFP